MTNLYLHTDEMQLLDMAQREILQKFNKLSPLLAEVYNSNPQPWRLTIADISIFLLPVWVENIFHLDEDRYRREKLVLLNFILAAAFSVADQILWQPRFASRSRSSICNIMALTTRLMEQAWDIIGEFSQHNALVQTYGALYIEDTWNAYAMEDANLLQSADTISNENLRFMGQRISWLKAGPMILAILAENESGGQTLLEGLQPLFTGMVLEHNVVQWKDNLRLGRQTLITSMLNHIRPALIEVPDGALDRPSCIGLISALTASRELYKKSLELLLPLESKPLGHFLANRLASVNKLRAELNTKLAWQNAMMGQTNYD